VSRTTIEIRRGTPEDWRLVREARLTALRDSPDWFCADHDEVSRRPEEWWRETLSDAAWFLAWSEDELVGMASGLRDTEFGPDAVLLISMWVAPKARGRGVGRRIVEAVREWSREQGAKEIRLEVTDGNRGAIELYERCGFVFTGSSRPHPQRADLKELEMVLAIERTFV
jgi:GNAT superfamily N-acetyltransferase